MAMNCRSKKGYKKGGVVTKMKMVMPKMGYKNSGVIGDVKKDRGVDTIDAKVRPGEYMLNPEAVKFIGDNDHANGVRQLNALVRKATGVEPGAVELGSLRGFANSGEVDPNMDFYRQAAAQKQSDALTAQKPTVYVDSYGKSSVRDLARAREKQGAVRELYSGTPRSTQPTNGMTSLGSTEITGGVTPSSPRATDAWTGEFSNKPFEGFRTGARGAINTGLGFAEMVLPPVATAAEAYSINRAQRGKDIDVNDPTDLMNAAATRAGSNLAGPAGALAGYYGSSLLSNGLRAFEKGKDAPQDPTGSKPPMDVAASAGKTVDDVSRNIARSDTLFNPPDKLNTPEAPTTPNKAPSKPVEGDRSTPLVTNLGVAGLRSGPVNLEPDRPIDVASSGNKLTLTAKDTGAPVGTISSSDNPDGIRRVRAGLASVGNDLGKYGNKLSTYDSKAYGKARLNEIADGLYDKAIDAGMSPERAAGLRSYAADIVTSPEKRQAYIEGIATRNRNAVIDKAVKDGKLSMKDVMDAQLKSNDLEVRKLERQQAQANIDRQYDANRADATYQREKDARSVAAATDEKIYDRNQTNYKQALDTVSRITSVPEIDSKGMPTGRTKEDPAAAERYMQQAQAYVDKLNESLPQGQKRDIRSFTPEEWRMAHKFLAPNMNLRNNINAEARRVMGDLASISDEIPSTDELRPSSLGLRDVFDKNSPVSLMDFVQSIPARDGTYEDTVLRNNAGRAVGRLDRLVRRPEGGMDKDLLRKFGYKG